MDGSALGLIVDLAVVFAVDVFSLPCARMVKHLFLDARVVVVGFVATGSSRLYNFTAQGSFRAQQSCVVIGVRTRCSGTVSHACGGPWKRVVEKRVHTLLWVRFPCYADAWSQ